MFLAVIKRLVVHAARQVHLCAYAVNLRHAVSFPFLYPVDERSELFVVVPETFEIIVVDEQLDVVGTVFAGKAACLAHIFEVAHIVLPVEGIATHVPCAAVVAI